MSVDWQRAGDPLRSVRRTRRAIRAEVDAELAFHLEMRRAELERRGLRGALVDDEVMRKFGNLKETRANCIASDERKETRMRRRDYLDELRQDLKMGVRQLGRRPMFAAIAVLTLAIGIGANTAIFSIADHVLLRPLPYEGAEQVVTVWETDARTGADKLELSPGDWYELQARTTLFESWGLGEPYGVDLTSSMPPEPLDVWLVTLDWFETIGVKPIIGRTFTPEETVSGGPPTVILTHGLWQTRFGGDPQIVGQRLELDGNGATVIGVLPPRIDFPAKTDLFAAKVIGEDEIGDHRSNYMRGVARLRPGVSIEQAQSELNTIAGQLSQEFAASNASTGVRAIGLEQHILGDIRPALFILLGAVGFVLLIACANVAGLLLARNSERERELAVRSALGAGRSRLIRQMLTESMVLGVTGGLLGLAIAWASVRAFALVSPPELPRADAVSLDGRVIAFGLAITVFTVLLVGLLPALRAARPQLGIMLRSGGRSVSGSRERQHLRRVLVTGEVALALVLVIGAGLLGRSFLALVSNDLGFATENRAMIQTFLWDRNPTGAQREQRVAEITEKLGALPGVVQVAVGTAPPFHPSRIDPATSIIRMDQPAPLPGQENRGIAHIVSPEYFPVMDMRVVNGRNFTASDRFDAPRVAILNETAARLAFGDESPIGKRITTSAMAAPVEREVVGVVEDTRPIGFDSDPQAEVYIPYSQSGTGSVTFIVHTQTDAGAMMPLLRERFWEVDPEQSIYHSATVEQLVGTTLVTRRFQLGLLGAFSVIALGLATIGIYGLISFSTQQRTNEIGVRMALGAQPPQIVRMIVSEGVTLAAPGIVIGVVAALMLTRFLASMLYGVDAHDPMTFAQLSVAVLLVAAIAAYLPARRAVSRDPLKALRSEQ